MDKVIQESYEKDALVFSWYAGSHPGIQVARRRCREINGLEDVLLNLVQFDEKARMSYEVLKHTGYDNVDIITTIHFFTFYDDGTTSFRRFGLFYRCR